MDFMVQFSSSIEGTSALQAQAGLPQHRKVLRHLMKGAEQQGNIGAQGNL